MQKIKYIMTISLIPVLFPEALKHEDFKKFNPVSAGFCSIDFNKKEVRTYGKSISLGLESDPSDAAWIERLLGFR